MTIGLARVVFAGLWFGLAVVLLARPAGMADELLAGRPPLQTTMLGLLAAVFGLYNLVRIRAIVVWLTGGSSGSNNLREALLARRTRTDRTEPSQNP